MVLFFSKTLGVLHIVNAFVIVRNVGPCYMEGTQWQKVWGRSQACIGANKTH